MSIALELGSEWLCAILASFTVAPAISIVDRAIIENASGNHSLAVSLRSSIGLMITRPLHFVRQPAFLLIWGVYAGTYITGNSIEFACRHLNRDAFMPKFVGSSAANVGLSLGKFCSLFIDKGSYHIFA
eukprot:Partr_v1_DN26139_c1_g1_i2_m10609 putative Conserved hypothetical protein